MKEGGEKKSQLLRVSSGPVHVHNEFLKDGLRGEKQADWVGFLGREKCPLQYIHHGRGVFMKHPEAMACELKGNSRIWNQKKIPFFPLLAPSKLIFIPFPHQLLICLARVCFVPRPRPNSFYRRLHEPLGSFKFKRCQLIIALWFLMWKHVRLIGPDPQSLEGKQQRISAGKSLLNFLNVSQNGL